jgi:hypothetical protein
VSQIQVPCVNISMHAVACIGFWHLAGIVHRARQIAGECITLHVLRDDKFVSN